MLISTKKNIILLFSLVGCFSLVGSVMAINSNFNIKVIPPSECNDTQDNDGDGLIDYPLDPECSSLTDNFESHQQCSDNYDNDSDGLIDYPADPGCSLATDNDETDLFQCNDNIDNDSDGLIDYPADPGCSSATDNNETNSNSGNNGGGPGFVINPVTSVTFSGYAYPMSRVSVLKDGQLAINTIAGPDARFTVSISNLSAGNYNFSLYSEENNFLWPADSYIMKSNNQLRRSPLFTFPAYITAGASTQVSGIFLSPILDVNKSSVKKGDNLNIFGQSVPGAEVSIFVNSDEEIYLHTKADADGFYFYSFDTSVLELGNHKTKSKTSVNSLASSFSKSISFEVGTKNIEKEDEQGCNNIPADLNCDNKVDLIDFSIAAFWYKRNNAPTEIDLNGDHKVDLIDFSIMAYYWTG